MSNLNSETRRRLWVHLGGLGYAVRDEDSAWRLTPEARATGRKIGMAIHERGHVGKITKADMTLVLAAARTVIPGADEPTVLALIHAVSDESRWRQTRKAFAARVTR